MRKLWLLVPFFMCCSYEKTKAGSLHEFHYSADDVGHGLYRIENDEVICYQGGGLSCKWK